MSLCRALRLCFSLQGHRRSYCCSFSVLRGDFLSVVLYGVSLSKEMYSVRCGRVCLTDRLLDSLVLIGCETAVVCTESVVNIMIT